MFNRILLLSHFPSISVHNIPFQIESIFVFLGNYAVSIILQSIGTLNIFKLYINVIWQIKKKIQSKNECGNLKWVQLNRKCDGYSSFVVFLMLFLFLLLLFYSFWEGERTKWKKLCLNKSQKFGIQISIIML